jgi:hypothetical protein
MSSPSTNDDSTSADSLFCQSLLSPLKGLLSKAGYELRHVLTAKERRIYVEYFPGNRGDRRAFRKILSKHIDFTKKAPDHKFVQQGIHFELHVPPNNLCQNGVQGFKGLVDTGAKGCSLIKASVVNDLKETYIPTQRFPKRRQDYVKKLRGIGENAGPLHIMGSTILQMFHPDAPGYMFHSLFYVVPDTEMEYDFLLGTDWIFSVYINVSWFKTRLEIATIGLLRRAPIIKSVRDDFQPEDHTVHTKF